MTNEIAYILKAFSLDKREQKIYLAALELGESLQVPLAEKAGMKRTTLREILPALLSQGILQQVIRGKRSYLIARDPRDLVKDLSVKAQRATELLPFLLALQSGPTEKPEVQFFDGIEGIKFTYSELLKVGKPMYSFLNIDNIHPKILDWLLTEFIPNRIAKKIEGFTILNSSKKQDEILPEAPHRHNCIVSAEKYPFDLDIIFTGEYAALIHYKQDQSPNAILIRSKATTTTLSSIYRLIIDKYCGSEDAAK